MNVDSLMSRVFVEHEPGDGMSTPCWVWTGALSSTGYGTVRVQGRTRGAHRVAYELARGPIPHGQVILHECDNRACVNPEHLSAGSQRDNARDRADKHRGHGQRRRPVGRRYW